MVKSEQSFVLKTSSSLSKLILQVEIATFPEAGATKLNQTVLLGVVPGSPGCTVAPTLVNILIEPSTGTIIALQASSLEIDVLKDIILAPLESPTPHID